MLRAAYRRRQVTVKGGAAWHGEKQEHTTHCSLLVRNKRSGGHGELDAELLSPFEGTGNHPELQPAVTRPERTARRWILKLFKEAGKLGF